MIRFKLGFLADGNNIPDLLDCNVYDELGKTVS